VKNNKQHRFEVESVYTPDHEREVRALRLVLSFEPAIGEAHSGEADPNGGSGIDA
jgi:hypothetical protein